LQDYDRGNAVVNRELDLAEAVNEALRQEMERDNRVIVFGEDVGLFGGVFACTKNLQEQFGKARVRDTPISEGAIIGAAIGAALGGLKPVAEIEFMDFIGAGGCMDQIFNQLAKIRYMFGETMKAPAVIRTACGSRYPAAGGASHHSQTLEAWFMHVPGLKVVVPSTPYDAKGLLISAIRDEDPVLFVEHKLMYYARRQPSLRSNYPNLVCPVPEEQYTIPFGKADIKRKGHDVTVVATMMMVHKALNAARVLSQQGIDVEVLDPRTLVPFDKQSLIQSVEKTGRAVVVSEDCKTGGVAAEISSIIMEDAFDYLDGPVKRVSGLDAPIPYSPVLECLVIPQEQDIIDAVKELVH
jgi:acetoin:2,6-dichlorophenolindophenol oxidoreductase subunit beta